MGNEITGFFGRISADFHWKIPAQTFKHNRLFLNDFSGKTVLNMVPP
jgi:hypothetical protein